jgi:AcrR family transcriptional regulator
MVSDKRDDLVEAALGLFRREGFHATGIDRILAEAGVAKMTLYHHFRSKDELILAALRLRDERFRNDFMRRVERSAQTPAARLLAIFDVLEDFCRNEPGGCTFINACAEYGDPESPIHRAAAEHKRMLLEFVTGLAVDSGAREPESLARQLCILVDGAIVTAQVTRDPTAAAEAGRVAQRLLADCGAEDSYGGDRVR